MSSSLNLQHNEIPQFLIKSTLGCSIVVVLILFPFAFSNLIQGNILLSLSLCLIVGLCVLNARYCFQGEYHLGLNTYFVSPIGAATAIYSLYYLGEIATYWPFVITLSYYVLPAKRAITFSIVTVLISIGSVWFIAESALAARFSAALIGTSLFAYLSMKEIRALNNRLREQAIQDHLTGLLNRTTLDNTLRHAIAQKQRTGMPMTILCFDIDNFKSINDTLGHYIGDNVLVRMGNMLRQRGRQSDKVFRTGGEEFLLLAYNTNLQQGVDIAEALRHQAEHSLRLDDRAITISFGVSELEDGMTENSWMKAADDKLYLAKRNGRNQVVA